MVSMISLSLKVSDPKDVTFNFQMFSTSGLLVQGNYR